MICGETIRTDSPLSGFLFVEQLIHGEWTKVQARWVNVARGCACIYAGRIAVLQRGRFRLRIDCPPALRQTWNEFVARHVERYGCVLEAPDMLSSPKENAL